MPDEKEHPEPRQQDGEEITAKKPYVKPVIRKYEKHEHFTDDKPE